MILNLRHVLRERSRNRLQKWHHQECTVTNKNNISKNKVTNYFVIFVICVQKTMNRSKIHENSPTPKSQLEPQEKHAPPLQVYFLTKQIITKNINMRDFRIWILKDVCNNCFVNFVFNIFCCCQFFCYQPSPSVASIRSVAGPNSMSSGRVGGSRKPSISYGNTLISSRPQKKNNSKKNYVHLWMLKTNYVVFQTKVRVRFQ